MKEQILKPLVADLEPDTLEMPQPRVVGCTVQEVCELDGEVVILGIPEEGLDDEGNSLHNCDQMGCGLCHVIYRFDLGESAENAQLREKLALSMDALKLALRVIDGLHEQQAIEDTSFLTQREIVEQALAIIDGKEGE